MFPKENTREGNQEWRGNNLPYLNGDNLMSKNNPLYVVLVYTKLRATDWSVTDGLKLINIDKFVIHEFKIMTMDLSF